MRRRVIDRVAACVVLTLAGCSEDLDLGVEVEAIALEPSVDVRIEAVTADTGLHVIASGGTLISQGRGAWELDHRLHDIVDVSYPCQANAYLVVVGDGGYVALSDNLLADDELELELQTTPSEADLWTVAAQCDNNDLTAVAAGDAILLVGRGDPQAGYEWIEPTPPPESWGQLRDVGRAYFQAWSMCAVGDAGRVICSEDLEIWERVELDTDEDLRALCPGHYPHFAVGAAGTLVLESEDSLWTKRFEPAVNMIGCSIEWYYLVAIGDDRTVYVEDFFGDRLEPHVELDWQPHAIDPQRGLILGGDRGQVGRIRATGFVNQ